MMTYCVQCGKELVPEARFCSACGAPNAAYPMPPQPLVAGIATRLIRPKAGRMIAGVCQGLAQSYGWDVVWVRVIAVLATIFSSGAGGIAYVVFWIVMPEELYALPAPGVVPASPGAVPGSYPRPAEPWK